MQALAIFTPPHTGALPSCLLSSVGLAVYAALALSSPACAAPGNGQVTAGDATISRQGGTTFVQQGSARTIINWQSFNLAPAESVVFNQPSAQAVVLNRITGSAPSNINGTLSANGRVFIINQRGIVFGRNAQVNVGDLVATTADTTDLLFMQGDKGFRTPGLLNSQVINQGRITARPGGNVLLLAPVVANQGSITANGGSVVLATGRVFLVDLFGDGLVQVATAVISGPPSGLVTQIGEVHVGAGTVLVRHAFGPGQLVGTLNSVPISELASRVVTLPGGAIALVGASQPTATLNPNWIKPSVGNGGGGVIDASPIYSVPAPTPIAAASRVADPAPPSPAAIARLSEFNRLYELPKQASSAGDGNQGAQDVVNVLYTTQSPGNAVAAAQPVRYSDEQRPVAPAPGGDSATDKRYCTVTELVRSGCR